MTDAAADSRNAPPVSEGSARVDDTSATPPAEAVAALQTMGRICGARGWIPATSGNFSVRLDTQTMLVTASGGDKAALTPADLLTLPIARPDHPRASAEAPLHAAIYRTRPEAGAIAHVHALSAVLIALKDRRGDHVAIEGLELQKALTGVTTHDTRIKIPVFDNDQDMIGLSARAATLLGQGQPAWGLLLAGHGLYAWGATAAAALRHVEALDALFRTRLALLGIPA